jgi:hypothetical protein
MKTNKVVDLRRGKGGIMTKKTCTAFGIFLAIALISVGAVIAKPESIPVGPGPDYLVSFDPGLPAGTYTIYEMPWHNSETYSGIKNTAFKTCIVTAKGRCNISVIEYNHWIRANQTRLTSYITSLLEMTPNTIRGEPVTRTRIVDGKPGVLGQVRFLDDSHLTAVEYPVDLSENETSFTLVAILSTVPWDVGTSSIIDTIHVTKVT